MAELYWSAKKVTKQETRKEGLQVASLLFPSSFEKSRKCDEVPGKCEYTNIINQTIEKSKCCCSVRATDKKKFLPWMQQQRARSGASPGAATPQPPGSRTVLGAGSSTRSAYKGGFQPLQTCLGWGSGCRSCPRAAQPSKLLGILPNATDRSWKRRSFSWFFY